MFLNVVNYTFFNVCSGKSTHNHSTEESPTFENVYTNLTWKQKNKVSEYNAYATTEELKNYLIFPHNKNINTDACNVIFASNKKTENIYSYSVINQPEVADFYNNVLVNQDFYKSLNSLAVNSEVINDFRPFLLQQHFVVDAVKYSVDESMADFLHTIFFKSQNKEEITSGTAVERFDSAHLENNLDQYMIINISRIHSEVKLDKFVFYVQLDNGYSSCFASEMETEGGVITSRITKIANIKKWSIFVPHTKNSRALAIVMTFCTIFVSGTLLIFGIFTGFKANKRFNSEEEQNARARYAEKQKKKTGNNSENNQDNITEITTTV